MVKISGTLTSNVTLSGRMLGGQPKGLPQDIKPVQKLEKPAALKEQQPDMTFSGIGRSLDIRV